jgi:diketogulonate reductase-like aldo/keto reductase
VPPPAISYAGAKEAIRKTLKEASSLKYIDLILLHAPYGGTEGRLGAWKALQEAVEAGTVRSIGVSNYGIPVSKAIEVLAQTFSSFVSISRN